MKVRSLQTFVCYLGPIHIGDEFEVDLPPLVFMEWVNNGLIEEVKTTLKKGVKK